MPKILGDLLAFHESPAPPREQKAQGHLSLVHEELPPYGLRAHTAKMLAPYTRMLAFIHERDPDRWKVLAAIIEIAHQGLGGGRRGRRQKTGD